MKTYTLDDTESKTLLNMIDDCIDRGMIQSGYEIDKINDIISESYKMYSESNKNYTVKIEVTLICGDDER